MTRDLYRLKNYPIYVFENSHSPFIWTDVFLREINRQPNQVILHLWPMEQTLILGMLDKQVPYLEEAQMFIRQQGYTPIVRHLGGLAVVADEGVLNFSLFLSNELDDKLEIKQAYHLMADLVRLLVADQEVTVASYEIVDSYCPGTYDLSINGRKFAGLAQRRIKDGIVVSCYISVCGNQKKRGELVSSFYEVGIKGERTVFQYPTVNPDVMANLSDLCPDDFTVAEIKERLVRVLGDLGQSLSDYQVTATNRSDFMECDAIAASQALFLRGTS